MRHGAWHPLTKAAAKGGKASKNAEIGDRIQPAVLKKDGIMREFAENPAPPGEPKTGDTEHRAPVLQVTPAHEAGTTTSPALYATSAYLSGSYPPPAHFLRGR